MVYCCQSEVDRDDCATVEELRGISRRERCSVHELSKCKNEVRNSKPSRIQDAIQGEGYTRPKLSDNPIKDIKHHHHEAFIASWPSIHI